MISLEEKRKRGAADLVVSDWAQLDWSNVEIPPFFCRLVVSSHHFLVLCLVVLLETRPCVSVVMKPLDGSEEIKEMSHENVPDCFCFSIFPLK